MSKQLQLRRGTTSDIASFTGAEGEVVYNTETKSLVTHDGTTEGGYDLIEAAKNYTNSQALGVGQTWQDVTDSREIGVTYTNTTGRPIAISLRFYTLKADGNLAPSLLVNDIRVAYGYQQNSDISDTTMITVTTIVPDGATYSYEQGTGAPPSDQEPHMFELR